MLCWLEDHKLACVALPKVMSTTLGRAFYALAEGRPFDPANHGGRYVHRYWKERQRAQGWADEPPPFAALAGYRFFTVLRDPVARLFSAYQQRVVQNDEITREFRIRAELPRFRDRIPGVDSRPDPERFVIDLPLYRMLSSSVMHHTAPYRNVLGDDLSRYDRVFRIEQQAEIGAWLAEATGQSVPLPVSQQAAANRPGLQDLGPAARRALAALMEDDYRLLADHYRPDPKLAALMPGQPVPAAR